MKYTFDLDYKTMWKSATDKALVLQKENTILKENAEHNDKVVDKVNWENMLLKKENKKQKEDFLKAIMELPKVAANNPISAMNGINVEDLMSAVDRFDKVPTYDELLRENNKQKEVITKTLKMIRDNYGVLDKYAIEMLEDTLKEVSE